MGVMQKCWNHVALYVRAWIEIAWTGKNKTMSAPRNPGNRQGRFSSQSPLSVDKRKAPFLAEPLCLLLTSSGGSVSFPHFLLNGFSLSISLFSNQHIQSHHVLPRKNAIYWRDRLYDALNPYGFHLEQVPPTAIKILLTYQVPLKWIRDVILEASGRKPDGKRVDK